MVAMMVGPTQTYNQASTYFASEAQPQEQLMTVRCLTQMY